MIPPKPLEKSHSLPLYPSLQKPSSIIVKYSFLLAKLISEILYQDKFSEIKYIRSGDIEDWVRSVQIIEERGDKKWVSTDSIIKIDGFDLTNKLLIECEVSKIVDWNSSTDYKNAAGISSGSPDHHQSKGDNRMNEENTKQSRDGKNSHQLAAGIVTGSLDRRHQDMGHMRMNEENTKQSPDDKNSHQLAAGICSGNMAHHQNMGHNRMNEESY